jgi:hypothetical protein
MLGFRRDLRDWGSWSVFARCCCDCAFGMEEGLIRREREFGFSGVSDGGQRHRETFTIGDSTCNPATCRYSQVGILR